MLIYLFLLGSVALQVTASTIPFWKRPDGTLGYKGPGSFLRDLGTAGQRADFSLVGGDSILDCPSNGLTNKDDALSAATSLVTKLGGSDIVLRSELCYHTEAGVTLAQVCNYSNKTITVAAGAVESAFDLIYAQCTGRRASGTIQTATGLQYAIFAKVGTGRQAQRRRSNTLKKRCLDTTVAAVTGCEDDVCTPAIALNESGDCPNVNNVDTDGCSYFCELRAARYYGVPVIYDDTRYCAGTNCVLEEGESFTVEKSVSFSTGLEGAGPLESVLSAGISFGIALSETTSVSQAFNFGDGACGYWYKVPVMIHTCGVLTEYEPNFGGDGGLLCASDAPFSRSVPNSCSEIQATAINSDSPDVFIVPKWLNCGDRSDLPDDQNSQAWKDTYAGDFDTVHTC